MLVPLPAVWLAARALFRGSAMSSLPAPVAARRVPARVARFLREPRA